MSHNQEPKTMRRPYVVATSGHIDHGKTALVEAITGIDTDRLQEEKKRGITIDLGFAHFEQEQGVQIAFVDVPGHEKFIHNMLAGMAGIDAVILVIAADKGVMPQTREHLNICNLLEIREGLIALTKIDLVEDLGMLELCKDEVFELVKGTFLEGKPVIPVSANKSDGIVELREELLNLFNKIKTPELENPFRLNVDRSFTLRGFGTVVTGTVLSGSISKEEEVFQFPQERIVRIRSMHTHGQKTDKVYAGQRAALNLAGIKKEEIKRGDQLGEPESLLSSYILYATFYLLENVSDELRNRTRIRLYLGSSEVIGRIIFLEGSTLYPGNKNFVRIILESLVSTKFGDRFIIRSFSPMITLGGGMVLDPLPSKSRRIKREIPERIFSLSDEDPNIRSEEVIYLQSVKGLMESEFSVRTDLSIKQSRKVFEILQSKKKIFCVNNLTKRYLHFEHIDNISHYVMRILELHHKKFIDRKGMTRAELVGKLRLIFNEKEVETLLNYLVKENRLLKNGDYYHLLEHHPQVSKSLEKSISQCIFLIISGGYQPMRRNRLLEELKLSEKDGLVILKSAVHSKKLLNVAQDLYFTPEKMEEILVILRDYLHVNKSITVIQFKELLNISRKYAIDLLEYFDRQRFTIREGNYRIPGTILFPID